MKKWKIVNQSSKIILVVMISLLVIGNNSFQAYAKTKKESVITGTRIQEIKQNIEGKDQVIGCSHEECEMHHNKKKYGEKGCVSGSDLLNIQVEINKDGKIKYKSLYDCKFKSMQGGCIKGKYLYIAFSDKGKNIPEKGDLTAIVKIKISNSKVKEVIIVKGAAEKNINSLGHANDLTFLGGFIHAAWYQEEGKTSYSNKMGYINKKLEDTGDSKQVGKKKEQEEKSIFGVGTYSEKNKKLALAFRHKNLKTGKTKRYVSVYQFKNKKYKNGKELFQLASNKEYSITQCMEYYKKYFYIIRFNKKTGKKDNNCIEKYNKKGEMVKKYIIADPNKIKIQTETPTDLNKTKIITKKMKSEKWEIECLAHYKKNTFYYTQYKPSTEKGKQAYLYKATIK